MKSTKLTIYKGTQKIRNMRYKTGDDFLYVGPTKSSPSHVISIVVADTGNLNYNYLVSLHAEIEAFLCHVRGIKEKDVTGFDLEHLDSDDPGHLKSAPYHKEHEFAMKIERLVAKELGVKWSKYCKTYDEMVAKYE